MVVNLYGPPVGAGEMKHMDYGRRRGPVYFDDRESGMHFSQTLSQYGYHHKWHRDRIHRDLERVESIHRSIDEPPPMHLPFEPQGHVHPTGRQQHLTFNVGMGKFADDIKDEVSERAKVLQRKPHLHIPEGRNFFPKSEQKWSIENSHPQEHIEVGDSELQAFFATGNKHDNSIHRYNPETHNPFDKPIEEPMALLHPHLDHNAHIPAHAKRAAMQDVRPKRDKHYTNSAPEAVHKNKEHHDLTASRLLTNAHLFGKSTKPMQGPRMDFLMNLPWPNHETQMAATNPSEIDKKSADAHSH